MATTERRDLGPGTPPALNIGALVRQGGVEFVLFSRHATAVTLLLHDDDHGEPTDRIILDPERNRLGDLWCVFVPDIGPGQRYAYSVDGPFAPEEGHRFDPSVPLIDPCSKALTTNRLSPDLTESPFGGSDRPKCVVVDDAFDWQGTRHPRRPMADTIIYETHVRGLTAHASAGVDKPGTYLGLIEKIPYFLELGITAIELLPIHDFDHLEYIRHNPETGELLGNYWGYSTIGFFAPAGRYAFGSDPGAQTHEFKTMVRELHRAGIEVILDVVFNHTAEGNQEGPTLHFKGIDNSIYYFLEGDRSRYRDFSGCGNSIKSNHPVVRLMIMDCLRYWVTHMGVDGFRFDLASVLSRDRNGQLTPNPPLLEAIAEDPILRDAKIIAEAWDAAGAYQVGSFPGGGRWAEWNGRFRDDVRRFWRGDPGCTGALATRLTGSSDLYQSSGRKPYHSINFITSHDGFPLNDLVSYNEKHNWINDEDNWDGDGNNLSFNHGVEGPTDNPHVERLRARQIRNFLTTLLVSQGVPMLLGGDDFRRTQQGNNNAYCQDNSVSWFDWTLLDKNRDLFRFCRAVIRFRLDRSALRRSDFFDGQPRPGHSHSDIEWFDAAGGPKVWEHDDQTLVCLIYGTPDPEDATPVDDVLLLFNASRRAVRFRLPEAGRADVPWRLFVDTGADFPTDIYPSESGPLLEPARAFTLIQRSIACLHRPHADA